MTHATVTDTSTLVRTPPDARGRISTPVATLEGSAILRVAGEIRQRIAAGEKVCNLTVGDFDPKYFPIPAHLESGIIDALHHRETNYPPSHGMPALREAIVDYTERSLGLKYPVECTLVTSGSRPGVYGTYATLVDPGDVVVYGRRRGTTTTTATWWGRRECRSPARRTTPSCRPPRRSRLTCAGHGCWP